MEITYKQLEELTAARESRAHPTRQDRRGTLRFPLRVRGTLICQRNGVLGEPVEVRMREVSSRGLSFLHSRGMRIGDQFFVRLPRRNARPAWLHCKVARSARATPEFFVIGAALLGTVNLDRRHDAA